MLFFFMIGVLFNTPLSQEEHGDIKIRKVILTTQLSDDEKPMNRVEEISLNENRIIIFLKGKSDLKEHTQFIKIYDGDGDVVHESAKSFIPEKSRWDLWTYHNINRNKDKPGLWKFEVYFNGTLCAENYLMVTSNQ